MNGESKTWRHSQYLVPETLILVSQGSMSHWLPRSLSASVFFLFFQTSCEKQTNKRHFSPCLCIGYQQMAPSRVGKLMAFLESGSLESVIEKGEEAFFVSLWTTSTLEMCRHGFFFSTLEDYGSKLKTNQLEGPG